MKISVIIPIYNSEKFLHSCVESVITQTYENLEIILINDGSSDNSAAICEEFSQKDKRIKVIHQSNKGVSAARNRGIQECTGQYISFIDSDDTLDVDMYEVLINEMKLQDLDIVHCGYKRIEGGKTIEIFGSKKRFFHNKYEALECLVGGTLFSGGLWNKLYRKSIIEPLFFEEKLKVNEDIYFNFQAFLRANHTLYIDVAKYNYYVRNTSACFTTAYEKKMQDVCLVSYLMLQQLEKTELEGVARIRHLQMLSVYYKYCIKTKNSQIRKKVALEMWNELQKGKVNNIRIIVMTIMIYMCPSLFENIYMVYDKIRRPNWEPKKRKR